MPYKDPAEQKQYHREYYENHKNPAHYKHLKLMKNYGITLEQFEQMLIDQDFKCKICRKEETTHIWGSLSYLSVDHCHNSGKIRALLCRKCNLVLGLVEDDPMLLGRMAEYLHEYSDDS